MNLTRRFLLTPEQRQAVEIETQDVVVLANPGGGKTALLVERIHHLVKTLQVPPESIMALTFTSKAATELRQRVHKRVGVTSKAMWIRAFHSAGLQLLRTFPTAAGLRDDFTIIDVEERKGLLCRFVLTQQRHRYLSDDELVDHITKVKNGMVLLSDLHSDIQMAIDLYERVMREQNAIDLNNMVVKAVDVLKNPAIRHQIHKRFHHILIDEYQDINAVQERLVQQMLGAQASRYLVGDPDLKRMKRMPMRKPSRSLRLSMSLISARPKERNCQKPLLLQVAVMRGFFLFWRKLSKIVVTVKHGFQQHRTLKHQSCKPSNPPNLRFGNHPLHILSWTDLREDDTIKRKPSYRRLWNCSVSMGLTKCR